MVHQVKPVKVPTLLKLSIPATLYKAFEQDAELLSHLPYLSDKLSKIGKAFV